ncbi:cytidylate kinase family protein [Candidatus Pacearchaeota archaeon]|nr:cytidylate kinase family protein [Candidatus Pacearchaeota archaeon]
MIIAINGLEGSGKDTVAKLLAKELDFKFYSMGDLFGKLAREKGMTLVEYHRHCETDDNGDREVDEYQETLGKKEDNFVIVGRMSAHFIPHAFKVFLSVDIDEGARRVHQDLGNRPDEHYSSVTETRESILERRKSNEKRYMDLYKINPFQESMYDLVVDTTKIPAREVVEQILTALRKAGKV